MPMMIRNATWLLFCLSSAAHAQEAAPAAAEKSSTAPLGTPQAKFFPIDRAHNISSNGRVKTTGGTRMRSDSQAMQDGFFRVDRSRTVPMAAPLVLRPSDNAPASMHTEPRVLRQAETPSAATRLPTTSTAPASNGTSPSGMDSILSLFESRPVAQAPSFRAALTGSSRPSNLIQHSWPIPQAAVQRVSSNYGFRDDPFNKKETKFHSGVDIAAPVGTPVLATADGQVIQVGTEGGYGLSVTLSHADGSESKYSHLSKAQASMGQRVRAGQTIGAVGSSGHSTGPHLDYRLAQEGVTIDPAAMQFGIAGDTPARAPDGPRVLESKKPSARTDRLIVVK